MLESKDVILTQERTTDTRLGAIKNKEHASGWYWKTPELDMNRELIKVYCSRDGEWRGRFHLSSVLLIMMLVFLMLSIARSS